MSTAATTRTGASCRATIRRPSSRMSRKPSRRRCRSWKRARLRAWTAKSSRSRRIRFACTATRPAATASPPRCARRSTPGGYRSDPVLLDQLLRDDDALHLVGAFADAQQRRVAVEPLDREFLGVAVAAVDAHRLVRVLERGLAREILGHARLQVAALAPVVDFRGVLDEKPRRLNPGGHLAELELDRLVLADRLAEGVALLRVPDRFRE